MTKIIDEAHIFNNEVLFNRSIKAIGGIIEEISNDRGDNNVTLITGVDSPIQRFATNLSVNRTITLTSTNGYHGAKFTITRLGLGAGTLNVGGLKTIPAATAAWMDIEFDGINWQLVRYGVF